MSSRTNGANGKRGLLATLRARYDSAHPYSVAKKAVKQELANSGSDVYEWGHSKFNLKYDGLSQFLSRTASDVPAQRREKLAAFVEKQVKGAAFYGDRVGYAPDQLSNVLDLYVTDRTLDDQRADELIEQMRPRLHPDTRATAVVLDEVLATDGAEIQSRDARRRLLDALPSLWNPDDVPKDQHTPVDIRVQIAFENFATKGTRADVLNGIARVTRKISALKTKEDYPCGGTCRRPEETSSTRSRISRTRSSRRASTSVEQNGPRFPRRRRPHTSPWTWRRPTSFVR
jgi:hypothetical protein